MNELEKVLYYDQGVGVCAVTSLVAADKVMGMIALKEKHIKECELIAEQYKNKINAWLHEQVSSEYSEIETMVKSLEDWMISAVEQGGKKTIEFVSGQIQLRKTPSKVEVADPSVLPKEFQRIKIEADKVPLKKFIEEKGEIPEGVEYIPGIEKLNVKIS